MDMHQIKDLSLRSNEPLPKIVKEIRQFLSDMVPGTIDELRTVHEMDNIGETDKKDANMFLDEIEGINKLLRDFHL